MIRVLIIIAVLVTVGILIYLFFPRDIIDYFSESISPTGQPQPLPPPSQATTAPPAPAPPVRPAPAPVSPGRFESEFHKIRKFADETQVRIIRYDEPVIGQVTMRLQSNDKNNIFDFIDAIERGIDLKDIKNVSNGYKIFFDKEGRQVVGAVIWIRYVPPYK